MAADDEVEFGDFDPDDAFDREPADPEQVARRVHELREFLEESAGNRLESWDDLQQQDQERETSLAEVLIDAANNDPDNAPQTFHEAVARLSKEPGWNDLGEDDRLVGTAVVREIIEWLVRQGAVRSA